MDTAFVTGAGRGLGRGFVDHFLGKGFTVFGGMRDVGKIDPPLGNNPDFIPVRIDITDDDSIRQAMESVAARTDHVDYLINNAGTNKDTATGGRKELVCTLGSLDRKMLVSMFDTNAVSPIMVLKRFLPLLTGTPAYVVNISSARSSYMDENTNSNANYGYRASKAALNLMTFCSLLDLPPNVRTYAVHPGSVRTDMNPTGTDQPVVQAARIIAISENWKDAFNGRLLRYDGTLYPMD